MENFVYVHLKQRLLSMYVQNYRKSQNTVKLNHLKYRLLFIYIQNYLKLQINLKQKLLKYL